MQPVYKKRDIGILLFAAFLAGVMLGKQLRAPTATEEKSVQSVANARTAPARRPARSVLANTATAKTGISKTGINDTIITSSSSANRTELSRPPAMEEDRLLESLHDPFPQAVEKGRSRRPDGSYQTEEETEAGDKITRSYNSHGDLKDEQWTSVDGVQIDRSYFDNGELKFFYENEAAGGKVYINFTQEGLFETRQDVSSDGSEIYTNYDESGHVYEKWRKSADGKMEKIFDANENE